MKVSKNKKTIAILMLIFIMFQTIQPVFAISGTGKWSGGQYASGMKTTDNAHTKYGIIIRRLNNVQTGERRTVFCAEHGIDFATGPAFNGTYYTPKDSKMRKACQVAYLGWYKNNGGYTVDGGILAADMIWVKESYVFTQQFIWEILGQSNATFIKNDEQQRYIEFKNRINNELAEIQRRPSFNGSRIDVNAGETKTIHDSNGVLSQYNSLDRTKDGVRLIHNAGSNDMQIIVDSNTNIENMGLSDALFESWGMIKNGTEDKDSMVFFEFGQGVQNQLYCMAYNDPITLHFSLKVNSFGNLELKKVGEKSELVNGAKFKITGDNFEKEVEVKNGKIIIDKLKKGQYQIKETYAPKGYLLNDKTYTINIEPGKTTKQTIVNESPRGTFTLIKSNVDKSSKLEGATYKIWNNKGYNKEFTTDSKGEIKVEGLELGTYKYKEVKAPTGYLIDTNEYSFELTYKDQYTKIVYSNSERTDNEPTGTITLVKIDEETGEIAQGDATLNNAVYELFAEEDIYNKARTKKYYSKGDLVATRNTNEKGQTDPIENLQLGKYKLKEKTASMGYLLDTNEYIIDLQYKDQNTKVITQNTISNELVKKMQLHIFKSGIKENNGEVKGLEGAEFTIKLNSKVNEALAKGYTYDEIWNGIDKNGNKVQVNSQRVKEANKIAPTIETIRTNQDGNAYTQNKLPFGKYIVKETNTPKDFASAEDFTFSISKDESEIKEVAQKVKTIVVNNEQLETYIKIVKKDLENDKIVSLNSATFEIVATEDIYDRGNGKILYKKGDKVSQKIGNRLYTSFTTNSKNVVVPDNSYFDNKTENGTIVTPLKLEVGNYEISEIKVPNGYLELEAPVHFEIKGIRDYDKDNYGDFIKEVIIKNDKPTGEIIVNKKINYRDDVDKTLFNKDCEDYDGIEFTIIAKENIIDPADGNIIYKKGDVVDTIKLDTAPRKVKQGIDNLPMGTYEIYESKTNNGLVFDDTRYEIKLEQKDNKTKFYVEEKEIFNDTTLVEFSKTDITGEKELEGAKLTVLDENGEIIDSWTSTDKTHKIEGLTANKEYILREEIAPNGYVKATDVKFKVENTKEIQKVKMIDKIVEMTKEDISEKEIEGAEIEVRNDKNEIVDSWKSTKEAHKIKGLEEGKEYTLIEKLAPNGYVIANDIKFKVTIDKETQKIKMIDKIVEITKEDISGKEIEGATLIVTNTKTKNIVDKWVSTKEPHKVSNLIEGETYILHEEIVADGYVKASDIEFTISEDKVTQKVKMIDKVVEIVKTDIVTGEEIEGAKLEVRDENGEIIDSWTSTKESHIVKGLEEDKKYKLVEITAPYGYEITEEIEFIVSKDKETQKIEMKDKPILKDIKLIKIDQETKENIKEKFTFGIYEDKECTKLIKEIKSNKDDGFIIFNELRYGKYFIKEIKAPKGYELSNKIIELDINDKGTFIDGERKEEKNNTIEFNFENTKIVVPKTGDLTNNKLLLGIIIASMLMATYIIIKIFRNK